MSARPTLQRGDEGDNVRHLQHRLIVHGKSLSPYGADGGFGALTELRVKEFQQEEGMTVDGVVGPATWRALEDKPEPEDDDEPIVEGMPPQPDFSPLVGNSARAQVFGQFPYTPAPTAANPEGIRILGNWAQDNIVTITVPQLAKISGIKHRGRTVGAGPKSGRVQIHKQIVDQFQSLWQAWEDAGLLDKVLVWSGLWNPRFIRGSRSVLSNHAWASAFDINAPWNGLGAEPAAWGKRGSVRELVELATEHGFYWGGFWQRRPDGMHFEAAKILG